jgi:hypothetical protein
LQGWTPPTQPSDWTPTQPVGTEPNNVNDGQADAGTYLASDGNYYPTADLPQTEEAQTLSGPDGPKPKRRGVLVAVSVGAALAIAAGGAGALLALRGNGGAGSPEDAAEAFLTELSSLDLAKITARIAPSEQDLIDPYMEAIENPGAMSADQKKTNEALEAARDAMSVELNGLEFASEAIAEGVDRTAVTGGTVTLDADIDKLADAAVELVSINGSSLSGLTEGLALGWEASTGDQLDLQFDDSLTREEIRDELDAFFPVTKEISDLVKMVELEDLFVVTVKEDGRWFSSPSMTVAQYLYESSGKSNADLGDPIPDGEMKGASKPAEAAANFVEGIRTAFDKQDIRELAKVLPVAESRLVAVYGPAVFDPDDLGSPDLAEVLGDVKVSAGSKVGSHVRLILDAITFGDDAATVERSGDTWTLTVPDIAGGLVADLTQNDEKTWTLKANQTDGPGQAENITASVSVPSKGMVEGEFSSPGSTKTTFGYKNGCFSYQQGEDGQELCAEELGVDLKGSSLDGITRLPDLKDLVGVSAVKGAGGDWYVSFVASLLDPAVVVQNAIK